MALISSVWLHSQAGSTHVVAQMAPTSCKLTHSQFRNSSKKSASFPNVSTKVPNSAPVGLNRAMCPSLSQSHGTDGLGRQPGFHGRRGQGGQPCPTTCVGSEEEVIPRRTSEAVKGVDARGTSSQTSTETGTWEMLHSRKRSGMPRALRESEDHI